MGADGSENGNLLAVDRLGTDDVLTASVGTVTEVNVDNALVSVLQASVEMPSSI